MEKKAKKEKKKKKKKKKGKEKSVPVPCWFIALVPVRLCAVAPST